MCVRVCLRECVREVVCVLQKAIHLAPRDYSLQYGPMPSEKGATAGFLFESPGQISFFVCLECTDLAQRSSRWTLQKAIHLAPRDYSLQYSPLNLTVCVRESV